MLLENDAFLSTLSKFFSESKTGKSLFITMKRHDGRTKPRSKKKDSHPLAGENCCLMRVVLGKKKISTIVYQKDMNKFNQAYSALIKANIDGLKKRDKRSAGTAASLNPKSSKHSSQMPHSSTRSTNTAPTNNP